MSRYAYYVQRLGAGYRSPDIRTVVAGVRDGFLSVDVRFAAGTFDPVRTRVSLYLDTDADESTGVQRDDVPPGTDHMISFGASGYYPTSMHHVYPRRGQRPPATRAEPYEVLADGLAIRIPLQRIGAEDSPSRLYVAADVVFDRDAATIIMDAVPGDTLPTHWVALR